MLEFTRQISADTNKAVQCNSTYFILHGYVKGILLDSSVEVSEGVVPLVRFLGFRWERVVCFTSCVLYPRGKGNSMYIKINSDPVNSFQTPISFPK